MIPSSDKNNKPAGKDAEVKYPFCRIWINNCDNDKKIEIKWNKKTTIWTYSLILVLESNASWTKFYM